MLIIENNNGHAQFVVNCVPLRWKISIFSDLKSSVGEYEAKNTQENVCSANICVCVNRY